VIYDTRVIMVVMTTKKCKTMYIICIYISRDSKRQRHNMYSDRIIIIIYYNIAFVIIIIIIILYFIFTSSENGTSERPEFIVCTINNIYHIVIILCLSPFAQIHSRDCGAKWNCGCSAAVVLLWRWKYYRKI